MFNSSTSHGEKQFQNGEKKKEITGRRVDKPKMTVIESSEAFEN